MVLGLWAPILAPEARAQGVGTLLAQTAGKWCLQQVLGYAATKAFDLAQGRTFIQQIKEEIPSLIADMAFAAGVKRVALQENLEVDREQLAVLTRLVDSNGKKLAEIQAEQNRLLERIKGLAARMSKLEMRMDRLGSRVGAVESRVGRVESRVGRVESRVDEVEIRVSQLEDALIRECLDLRTSQVLGVDEFRVKESPGGWISDHFEDDNLTLDARLLLNSCSADLTRRGLLLQLSLVTRGLDEDLSLYANFKGISSNGGTGGPLTRQEIPLARPEYEVDGQVIEIFFPYDEIPGLSPNDRTALALVLTHDGEVLYSLPDRPISCVFGQRINCRWR